MISSDGLLVSFATNQNGSDFMIVARKLPNGMPDIINAFEGSEAHDIYEKLIGKKEDE